MPARWQPPDLDEFRPEHFVITNEKVRPLLRGEGERDGRFFVLQSMRRMGGLRVCVPLGSMCGPLRIGCSVCPRSAMILHSALKACVS